MQSRRDFFTGLGAGAAALGAGGLLWNHLHPYRVPPFAQLYYAQVAEDVLAQALFHTLKIESPRYLDIGAFHPIYSNNTYLLYQRGCRGVLVEPNVDLIELLKKERPGDTVLNAGIGFTAATEADYYVMTLPQWNTFSKEEAERSVKESNNEVKIERVVKMPLLSINDVIAKHFDGKVNFISIDTEGLDLDILKSLDFTKYRPEVFCVETIVRNSKKTDPEIEAFMASKGYVPRGGSIVNTLFVEKTLLDS